VSPRPPVLPAAAEGLGPAPASAGPAAESPHLGVGRQAPVPLRTGLFLKQSPRDPVPGQRSSLRATPLLSLSGLPWPGAEGLVGQPACSPPPCVPVIHTGQGTVLCSGDFCSASGTKAASSSSPNRRGLKGTWLLSAWCPKGKTYLQGLEKAQ
jgi:hypothetical protein